MANVKTVGNKQKTSSLLCIYPLKILIFYQDGMLASTELIHISYYMLSRDCWENASLMINVTFWSLWELTINQVLSRVTTLSCSKLEICSKEHWSWVDLGNSDVWGMQCFCNVVSKLVSEHAQQHCKNTASPKHLNYRGLIWA